MMHGRGKSDPAIVAVKPANKAERFAAEPAEPRAGAEGNVGQYRTDRAQNRATVSQALERIRQVARQGKKEKFTTLLHHISTDHLEQAFLDLKEGAAAGVDGLRWQDYEADLERNLENLHARVHRGAYRAQPSRRVYIPKPCGRKRALAVAALEDKIVQRATAAVLNAIYEEDFLGFSYGFRPGRGAHDALDALMVALKSRKVNFIFDADIRSFFDTVSQKWLIRFLEHRIGDKRIIRVFEVRSYAMARLSFGKPRSLIADRSLGTSAKPWCVWAGRRARSSMFRMMTGRAALSGSLKARRCGRWG